jgi:hypothetical protein
MKMCAKRRRHLWGNVAKLLKWQGMFNVSICEQALRSL